jgi:hypothetical protein
MDTHLYWSFSPQLCPKLCDPSIVQKHIQSRVHVIDTPDKDLIQLFTVLLVSDMKVAHIPLKLASSLEFCLSSQALAHEGTTYSSLLQYHTIKEK